MALAAVASSVVNELFRFYEIGSIFPWNRERETENEEQTQNKCSKSDIVPNREKETKKERNGEKKVEKKQRLIACKSIKIGAIE